MSEKELKPCPFCGEQVFTPLVASLDDGYTRCISCGAEMQRSRWQTRPIEDALNARIAELEMKIRHNALWQASEDAEERAHLEKLVPDLKKRIADLVSSNMLMAKGVLDLKARIAELEAERLELRKTLGWAYDLDEYKDNPEVQP